MNINKWVRRAKLMAIGLFIGFIVLWLGVMIAGALSDTPNRPSPLDRVLKK